MRNLHDPLQELAATPKPTGKVTMTMIESTVAESVLSALRAWRRAMFEPDFPVRSWPTPDEVADVAGLDRAQVVSELGRWKVLARYMGTDRVTRTGDQRAREDVVVRRSFDNRGVLTEIQIHVMDPQ